MADNGLHQCYVIDYTKANISNMISLPLSMTSSIVTESIGPDSMDAQILNLLSTYDTHFASLDLSSQRDMTSGLKFLEMGVKWVAFFRLQEILGNIMSCLLLN